MRHRARGIVAVTMLLVALSAGCSSSKTPGPAAGSGAASPSAPALPSPCASTVLCFKSGSASFSLTGATTTAFSAPLDIYDTYTRTTGLVLVYATGHVTATVGVVPAQVGDFTKGAVRLDLYSIGSGYVGQCGGTVVTLSAAGTRGTISCPDIPPLLGGSSTGRVTVTGTFSAGP